MPPILQAILIAFAWSLALLGVSWPFEKILHRLRGESPFPTFSFGVGMGLATLSFSTLILAMSQTLRRGPLLTLALIPLTAGILRLARICLRRSPNPLAGLGPFSWTALGVFLLALPFASLPPTHMDALVYHLEVPRIYLAHGGIVEIPGNMYAYFPQSFDMLYLLILALLPAFASQIVHASFLPLCLLAVGEIMKAAGHKDAAHRGTTTLFLLAVVSIPSLFLDATIPYLDMGLTFYCLLFSGAVYLAYRLPSPLPSAAASFAAGFLVSIKYTGYYFLAAAILACLILFLIRKTSFPAPRAFLLSGAASYLLFAGPYCIRNMIWTSSPLFPFLAGILGPFPNGWDGTRYNAYMVFLRHYGQYLPPVLHPLNYLLAAISPVLNDAHLFDGVLGPFLLTLPILWILTKRRENATIFLLLLITLFALIWGVSLRQGRFLLPTIPILLLLLLVNLPDVLNRQTVRRLAQVFGTLCLGFNLFVLIPVLTSPKEQFSDNPHIDLAYLAGQKSPAQFLSQNLNVYNSHQFLNSLPRGNTRVWLLLTSNRNFYLNQPFMTDWIVEDITFQRWLREMDSPDEMARKARQLGITHILTQPDVLFLPTLYQDRPELRRKAAQFLFRFFRPVYSSNGFVVFEFRPSQVKQLPGTSLTTMDHTSRSHSCPKPRSS